MRLLTLLDIVVRTCFVRCCGAGGYALVRNLKCRLEDFAVVEQNKVVMKWWTLITLKLLEHYCREECFTMISSDWSWMRQRLGAYCLGNWQNVWVYGLNCALLTGHLQWAISFAGNFQFIERTWKWSEAHFTQIIWDKSWLVVASYMSNGLNFLLELLTTYFQTP